MRQVHVAASPVVRGLGHDGHEHPARAVGADPVGQQPGDALGVAGRRDVGAHGQPDPAAARPRQADEHDRLAGPESEQARQRCGDLPRIGDPYVDGVGSGVCPGYICIWHLAGHRAVVFKAWRTDDRRRATEPSKTVSPTLATIPPITSGSTIERTSRSLPVAWESARVNRSRVALSRGMADRISATAFDRDAADRAMNSSTIVPSSEPRPWPTMNETSPRTRSDAGCSEEIVDDRVLALGWQLWIGEGIAQFVRGGKRLSDGVKLAFDPLVFALGCREIESARRRIRRSGGFGHLLLLQLGDVSLHQSELCFSVEVLADDLFGEIDREIGNLLARFAQARDFSPSASWRPSNERRPHLGPAIMSVFSCSAAFAPRRSSD